MLVLLNTVSRDHLYTGKATFPNRQGQGYSALAVSTVTTR